MTHRGLLVATAAVLAMLAGAPHAAGEGGTLPASGSIRGRVEILRAVPNAEPRPAVAALGADPVFHPQERRSPVVYLETAPQAAFDGGETVRARLSQVNETFVPHVLAVRVGTIVDFPNDDTIYHNVFSFSKVKRFDLGRYAKGRSKSVRFDEPGIVRVFCDIHSHMNAFILVFAHRFFSVADQLGRYHIDQVPPGTYTLMAWYEGAFRQTRSVTVPADGSAVEIDFEVR